MDAVLAVVRENVVNVRALITAALPASPERLAFRRPEPHFVDIVGPTGSLQNVLKHDDWSPNVSIEP